MYVILFSIILAIFYERKRSHRKNRKKLKRKKKNGKGKEKEKKWQKGNGWKSDEKKHEALYLEQKIVWKEAYY